MKIPNKIHSIDLTTIIGCRLDCHYCPQRLLVQRYKELFANSPMRMSMDDFKVCLTKLKKHMERSIFVVWLNLLEILIAQI